MWGVHFSMSIETLGLEVCCPETSSKQDQFPGFDCLILGAKRACNLKSIDFCCWAG